MNNHSTTSSETGKNYAKMMTRKNGDETKRKKNVQNENTNVIIEKKNKC